MLGPVHLPTCLQALAAQDYPSDKLDVILVNNGPRDIDSLVARAGLRVQVLKPGRNLGFAAANNLGVAHASAGSSRFSTTTPVRIAAGCRAPSRWSGGAARSPWPLTSSTGMDGWSTSPAARSISRARASRIRQRPARRGPARRAPGALRQRRRDACRLAGADRGRRLGRSDLRGTTKTSNWAAPVAPRARGVVRPRRDGPSSPSRHVRTMARAAPGAFARAQLPAHALCPARSRHALATLPAAFLLAADRAFLHTALHRGGEQQALVAAASRADPRRARPGGASHTRCPDLDLPLPTACAVSASAALRVPRETPCSAAPASPRRRRHAISIALNGDHRDASSTAAKTPCPPTPPDACSGSRISSAICRRSLHAAPTFITPSPIGRRDPLPLRRQLAFTGTVEVSGVAQRPARRARRRARLGESQILRLQITDRSSIG